MKTLNVPSRTLSVLVVDDNADTAWSLTELLNMHGFSARAACSALEALDLAWVDPPDVVVLDLVMPRMTGWELAAALMDCAKPPVLIAISGACGALVQAHSARSPINIHLTKPADPAEVVGVLLRVGEVLDAMRAELPLMCGT